MGCKKCIFPRNCENYDEVNCKDCRKYEHAVPVGIPLLEYECFKCKHEDACVAFDKRKSIQAYDKGGDKNGQ